MNNEIIENPLIQNKIQQIQKKYNIVLEPETIKKLVLELEKDQPSIWGMLHRSLKGKPYRFLISPSEYAERIAKVQHRPFLIKMLDDQTNKKCIQKSRQAGVSENAVTELVWFLKTHPRTKAVYTFPSKPQMEDFSNSRVQPAFDENEYMRSLLTGINNVSNKQIGDGSFLLMRSAATGRLGEGIDADVAFFDERDRMDEKIEAAFSQSLSASAYGYLREFSTPTLPGKGINKMFQSSCQYRWFVRCESGHAQTLTYPDNIGFYHDMDMGLDYVEPGTCYFKCNHKDSHGVECSSEINRWKGEWVAAYPERAKDIAGFHINQLSCVWITADDIMNNFKKYRFLDLFYNYVLGEIYADSNSLMTEELLISCLDTTRGFVGQRKDNYVSVTAGIDWGYLNWCVVLGKRIDGKYEVCGIKWVEDNKDVLIAAKEIGSYLAQFRPDLIVADLGYGRDRCMELQRQYPERVFACSYTNTVNDKTFNPIWTAGQSRVSVNRTAHLRNMTYAIKNKKLIFPGLYENYDTMFKHILNLVPLHEELEDSTKEDVVIVEKIDKKGPDHLSHALAYAILAMEKISGEGFAYIFA